MKRLGMIKVFLTMVLILPLSVWAQPPGNPPPDGPINDLRELLEAEIQNLQDQIDHIQSSGLYSIYIKKCTDQICACDDTEDLIVAVGGECRDNATAKKLSISERILPGCALENDGMQFPVEAIGDLLCVKPANIFQEPLYTSITCLKGAGPLTCEVKYDDPVTGCKLTSPLNCNFLRLN